MYKMFTKTIKRPINKQKLMVFRDGEHVDIAIIREDGSTVQEIILSRNEIKEINGWVNGD